MGTIKAIIIDDESLARDLVRSYLGAHKEIEILGEYSDGFQGLKAIVYINRKVYHHINSKVYQFL
ncbi:MAG: hypothetical protein COC06_10675 [Bacteroidales bacterium]|nr:MAG: hypothetical protein COC06_10675 [Bacteroidales bacterium]